MNYWFLLKDIGKYREKIFSCISGTNNSKIEYSLLDLDFKITVELFWFAYNRRRRESENIDRIRTGITISVPEEDITGLNAFKSGNPDGKKIEKIINENIDMKIEVINKYSKIIGSKLYDGTQVSGYPVDERIFGLDDIIMRRVFVSDEYNDYSRITDDLRCCLIKPY